jgi:hypothetical protein
MPEGFWDHHLTLIDPFEALELVRARVLMARDHLGERESPEAHLTETVALIEAMQRRWSR